MTNPESILIFLAIFCLCELPQALQDVGVWEVVPVAECIGKTQRKPIRGRWVDVNNGDDQVQVFHDGGSNARWTLGGDAAT